jgi:hypothetical protein
MNLCLDDEQACWLSGDAENAPAWRREYDLQSCIKVFRSPLASE